MAYLQLKRQREQDVTDALDQRLTIVEALQQSDSNKIARLVLDVSTLRAEMSRLTRAVFSRDEGVQRSSTTSLRLLTAAALLCAAPDSLYARLPDLQSAVRALEAVSDTVLENVLGTMDRNMLYNIQNHAFVPDARNITEIAKIPVNFQRKYAKDYRERYFEVPAFALEYGEMHEEVDAVQERVFIDWFWAHQAQIQEHAQAFWLDDLKTEALCGIISVSTQLAHAVFLVRPLGCSRKLLKQLLPLIQSRHNQVQQVDPFGATADELLV